MREIKFRVWTGLKMEYDVVVGKLGAFYCAGLDPKDTASLSPSNTKYDENTSVMQYTGLKDKNGVEIYEGDILNSLYVADGCEGLYEVIWIEGGFRVGRYKKHQQTGVTITMGDLTRCKVIGNIYKNPELLKGN